MLLMWVFNLRAASSEVSDDKRIARGILREIRTTGMMRSRTVIDFTFLTQ